MPSFDGLHLFPDLLHPAFLEDDGTALLRVASRHAVDAAARTRFSDALDRERADIRAERRVLERVFQSFELVDLDALAEARRNDRLADVQQRVPHALEVVRDEENRDESLRELAGFELDEDVLELLRVHEVENVLGAADLQRELHVAAEYRLFDQADGPDNFVEEGPERPDLQQLVLLDVGELPDDVLAKIRDALEIAGDDVDR